MSLQPIRPPFRPPMLSRNARRFSLLIAIALLAGGVWLFWPAAPSPAPEDQVQPPSTVTAHAPTPSASIPPVEFPAPDTTAPVSSESPEVAPPLTIDAILTNPDLDNTEAARALGTLVQDPALSLPARSEALAHMLNLSVDHETTLLLPLLQSPQLPDALASTILSDALNRPLSWQADACLAVMARRTGKDLHAQARDHLTFLAGADHGDDLAAWNLAIRDARPKWEATDK